MTRIRIHGTLLEGVLRHGIRGCKVVRDKLPKDATLTSAFVREDKSTGDTFLMLYFDDDFPGVRDLNPTFSVEDEDSYENSNRNNGVEAAKDHEGRS